MKKQFVNDLRAGIGVDSLFAVKIKKPPQEYRGGKMGLWFEMRVSDRGGEIGVKFWGEPQSDTKDVYESVRQGDVVRIRGTVREFGNALEISINPSEDGAVERVETFDKEDFVKRSKRRKEDMEEELKKLVGMVHDEELRTLLRSFFMDKEFLERFSQWPAAMERHQNFIGGLMEHTLNVANIALRAWDLYPEMNRDYVITGALLHDIGKTREFTLGTTIDVSEEGMLIGHLTMGAMMVEEKIREMRGFDETKRMKVVHMLLSHHGKLHFGAPKIPQFPEAMAVYYADEMDSKLEYMLRLKNDANTEDSHIYTKDFGNVYLK